MRRRSRTSPQADREKKRQRRGIRSLFTFAFFLIACVVIASFFFNLPVWRIEYIHIEGLHVIPEQEILTKMAPLKGEHIFLAQLWKFQKELEKFPPVWDVSIHRRLPSGLVVKIVERTPQAMLVFPEGSFLIDAHGTLLTKHFPIAWYHRVDLEKLPVIRGIPPHAIQGDVVSGEYVEMIRTILPPLLTVFSANRFQLDLHSLDQVMIHVEDFVKVKLGTSDQLREKIHFLEALWSALGKRAMKLEYIDLTFFQQPVIKFKS